MRGGMDVQQAPLNIYLVRHELTADSNPFACTCCNLVFRFTLIGFVRVSTVTAPCSVPPYRLAVIGDNCTIP